MRNKLAVILSIAASLCLIFSRDTFLYIIGQSFVGAAAGIYWPAAEFGVPYFCHPIETRKAYALVRSSEALGIFLGVFLGGYMTNFLYSKSCLLYTSPSPRDRQKSRMPSSA